MYPVILPDVSLVNPYTRYPSENSLNDFFHDNVTLSALFAIARARAFVRVSTGILDGGTGVESGSQKARPLTLAATHCVFLPARAREQFLPPSFSSFLLSFLGACRVSPFSLCYARESCVVITVIWLPGGDESAS